MLMLRPLLRYADFQGRARRAEYWQFAFVQTAIYLAAVVGLLSAISAEEPKAAITTVIVCALVIGVTALGTFLPNLAVTVRRLHDSGKSGLWLLLYLPGILSNMIAGQAAAQSMLSGGVTEAALASTLTQTSMMGIISAVCNLVMLVFMFWPGTHGENRFGPDPKHSGPDIRVFDGEGHNDRIDAAIAEAHRSAKSDAGPVPHKPIFDFGPGSEGPMITLPTRETAPVPIPAATPLASAWAKPDAPRKTFGRRQ